MSSVHQLRTLGRRAFEPDEPIPEMAEPSDSGGLTRAQEDAASVFGGSAASADSLASGLTVEATVKWFNAEKGYGFVELTGGRGDAFLHLKTLRQIGRETPTLGGEGSHRHPVRLARRAGGRHHERHRTTGTAATTADPRRIDRRRFDRESQVV